MNHVMYESCTYSVPGQDAWQLRVVSAFYSVLRVLRFYIILEKEICFTAGDVQELEIKSSTSEYYQE